MIKGLIIIITIGSISFIFTDVKSPSVFFSVMLPLGTFIALVALAIWWVVLLYKLGVNQTSGSSGGGPGDFGGFGDAW